MHEPSPQVQKENRPPTKSLIVPPIAFRLANILHQKNTKLTHVALNNFNTCNFYGILPFQEI